MQTLPSRRRLLQLAAASVTVSMLPASAEEAETSESSSKKPWLRKTLKIGMIGVKGSLEEKFAAAKAAGFEGVELDVPGINAEESIAAAKNSGLIIDGTVGGYHWNVRHTDPSPQTRAKALDSLRKGIEQTAAVGADTMLLVPGHGKDGTAKEVYDRAKESMRRALSDAEQHGVTIVMENVWNEMFYDPQGGTDQTADAFAAFIDDFDSPWVAAQFDIGNHWKFGDPAAWIRTLAGRIKKLDIKGFSRANGKFTKITEGDIDWPTVKQALREIRFTGWLAAEVGGGDAERLREVSQNMDKALQCSEPMPA